MAKTISMDLDTDAETCGECHQLPSSNFGVLRGKGKDIGYQQLYASITQTTAIHYAFQQSKLKRTGSSELRRLARQRLLEVVLNANNFLGCFEGVKEDMMRAGHAELKNVEYPTDLAVAAASKWRDDLAGLPAMETKPLVLDRTQRVAHVAQVIMVNGMWEVAEDIQARRQLKA